MNRPTIRRSQSDPNRFYLDFDPVCPGGLGGGCLFLDPEAGFVSVDGIHKNSLLPTRSTGSLLADCLLQVGVHRPLVLEAYNVDKDASVALDLGFDGSETAIGCMLDDAARELGGMITRWESEYGYGSWDLRIHIAYP